MRVISVRTNDPEREQWRALLRYAYARNIRDVFAEFRRPAPSDEEIERIAGACRQAHAYFEAARAAPLDISPLMLYYGAANVLAAVAALRLGAALDVGHHGMRLDAPAPGPLGDVALVADSSPRGALGTFAALLGADPAPGGGERWTLREVLAGIPDVASSYDWPYEPSTRLALPVEVVEREHETLERIPRDAFAGGDPLAMLRRVPRFDAAYLRPFDGHDAVVLYPRRGGEDAGTYGVLGDKYLVMGVARGGRTVQPPHALAYLMGLFVLGTLSRYHANVWHPFVRGDTTGERASIERFVDVARRLVPRLALEALYGARWRFDTRPAEPVDARERVSPVDVERLARRERERAEAADARRNWSDAGWPEDDAQDAVGDDGDRG